jgi:hypothetical protein
MVTAIFALIFAVASWSAWRRNPMYSRRLTLRLLAVIVFGVAGVFAAVIAAGELTQHSSGPVTAAAIGGTCFVSGLAFVWLIVQFTIPSPPLPAGTQLATLNRAKLIPWVQRFGWAAAGVAILALVLPGPAKAIAYAVGGLLLVLAGFSLFTVYAVALHLDRSLTSVEIDPWLHWRYTPEEWTTWSAVEVARIQAATPQWAWQRDWKALAIIFAVLAIPYALNVDPADWKLLTALLVLSWLVVLGLLLGIGMYAQTAPYRMQRLLAHAVPDTYIGAAGVCSDGIFNQWQNVGNYLTSATLDERDPRSITLVFVRSVSGGGTIEVTQNVLIPAGADGDIAKLQSLLAAALPGASIGLVPAVTMH